MPRPGHTTKSTKREWATAVRRHDCGTGLGACCLPALLLREGTREVRSPLGYFVSLHNTHAKKQSVRSVQCNFFVPLKCRIAFTDLSPHAGVRGLRTVRAADPVHAQRERGAAERRLLRREPERGGPEVHAGRVRYVF